MTYRVSDSTTLARGRSEGINKTLRLFCEELGIRKPRKGTPDERRRKVLDKIKRRLGVT